MPGLIRRSDIDEVRSRTNIADVVGDYVTLKSAGVGSMKGLCPFHEERSPSFHVRPQVGLYHCFGCGEGGDVYSFLQKVDHLTFTEAVERLAGKLGYQLHYEDGGQASDHGNRARLLAANAAAEAFFRAQLTTPPAQSGRDFLGSRGFDAAAAEQFGVGFAPRSFSALSDHLESQGFTEAELLTAGLLSTGERGRSYDRFRGRLVWPIRDITGQTIGFGARKLYDDDQGPKYLNTPETPVYHKAQVLYGLDLARKAIATGKQVVVVEGYTDVMACHLAGVPTAVATCGTSFGTDHIKVIRRVLGDVDNTDTRGTGRVVFTFDPDEAGQKAASRAFVEEQAFTAQTFVAVAADGLDPCDLRLQRGDDAIRSLIAKHVPMFEFMIRRVLAGLDIGTAEGRAEGLRRGVPIVAGIRDEALLIEYEKQLASLTGTDVFDVRRMVQSARRGRRGGGANRDRPGNRGPGGRPDQARSGDQARPSQPQPPQPQQPAAGPSIVTLPVDAITRSERDALIAILQRPDAIGREYIGRALAARIQNSTLAVVRDVIASNLDRIDASDWVTRLAEEAPAGFGQLITQLAVAPIPAKEEHLDSYCVDVVTSLLERDLLRQKAELLGALQRAGVDGDQVAAADLNRRLAGLELERRRLRPD